MQLSVQHRAREVGAYMRAYQLAAQHTSSSSCHLTCTLSKVLGVAGELAFLALLLCQQLTFNELRISLSHL